jgi:hypothetical protein
VPSVTELVVAQCYYLDFDDRNRQRPIYVYLNSTGCINDKGQVRLPSHTASGYDSPAPGSRALKTMRSPCALALRSRLALSPCALALRSRLALSPCALALCSPACAPARVTLLRPPTDRLPPGHLCGQRVLRHLGRAGLHARAAIHGRDVEGAEPGCRAAQRGAEGAQVRLRCGAQVGKSSRDDGRN